MSHCSQTSIRLQLVLNLSKGPLDQPPPAHSAIAMVSPSSSQVVNLLYRGSAFSLRVKTNAVTKSILLGFNFSLHWPIQTPTTFRHESFNTVSGVTEDDNKQLSINVILMIWHPNPNRYSLPVTSYSIKEQDGENQTCVIIANCYAFILYLQ